MRHITANYKSLLNTRQCFITIAKRTGVLSTTNTALIHSISVRNVCQLKIRVSHYPALVCWTTCCADCWHLCYSSICTDNINMTVLSAWPSLLKWPSHILLFSTIFIAQNSAWDFAHASFSLKTNLVQQFTHFSVTFCMPLPPLRVCLSMQPWRCLCDTESTDH